ncbi:hypothetical protein EMCG_00221 [[Emmonsia] crescens]|uniref:Serine/threonine-protein kinase ATG1 n=1 Tax=[Emmonsia] crescens TaxID=73230 RepID=A0A0G2I815_9EURO|nr:hypothetical protein EMCG_00221 [Emmonsia crescens UAMH 3008]
MPLRSVPHPQALFSLVPLNGNAQAVINHPANIHLLSSFTDNLHNTHVVLNVGFHIGSDARYTLATLGRNGDITVDGPNISRIQCSFEVHPESDVVMLYDESNSQTTQVFGKSAMPFKPGRLRKVVVDEDINCMFGMGGIGCDQVQFLLAWHRVDFNAKEEVGNRVDSPLQARTADDVPTVVPSEPPTPGQWPSNQEPKIRYKILSALDQGSFGVVSKAVDMDSGRPMAVKCIPQPQGGFKPQQKDRLKREILALSKSSHPHIVEYIHFHELSNQLQIFTALKEGNVDGLIGRGVFDGNISRANVLLDQMLQALDYLAHHGIIHRDVKPANILFMTIHGNGLRYQLTDFGLCNAIDVARSNVGSPMFKAPELRQGSEILQTPKVDIWSLFVTVAYAMDADGYRSKQLDTEERGIDAALEAARTPNLQRIKDMAEIDPNNRPSAAQMLVTWYGGTGLTTPPDQVNNSFPASHILNNNAYNNSVQRLELHIIGAMQDVVMGSQSDITRGPQLRSVQVAPANPAQWPTGLGMGGPREGPQWQSGVPNRVTNAIGAENQYHPLTDTKRQAARHQFPANRRR